MILQRESEGFALNAIETSPMTYIHHVDLQGILGSTGATATLLYVLHGASESDRRAKLRVISPHKFETLLEYPSGFHSPGEASYLLGLTTTHARTT